jgi:hypothetical protein
VVLNIVYKFDVWVRDFIPAQENNNLKFECGKGDATGTKFVICENKKTMAKYSKTAQKKVKRAMHEKKDGTLRTGSGKKVTSRKKAIAIGLSEARKEGAKVPKKSAKKTRRKNTRT